MRPRGNPACGCQRDADFPVTGALYLSTRHGERIPGHSSKTDGQTTSSTKSEGQTSTDTERNLLEPRRDVCAREPWVGQRHTPRRSPGEGAPGRPPHPYEPGLSSCRPNLNGSECFTARCLERHAVTTPDAFHPPSCIPFDGQPRSRHASNRPYRSQS